MLAADLSDKNYYVLFANNGKEALDILTSKNIQISVILCDLIMPELNGYMLLEIINKNPDFKYIPVIILSAVCSTEEIKKIIKLGAYHFLPKPYNISHVNAVIDTAAAELEKISFLLHQFNDTREAMHNACECRFEFKTLHEGERVVRLLAEAAPEKERFIMGLYELIRNAVEHGNLGISYQEKAEMLGKDIFEQELDTRLKLPENLNKTVRVVFKKFSEQIKVHITDSGRGFDYNKYQEIEPERIFDLNGRGIVMAKYLFLDDIQYIDPGNEVIGIINL